MPLTHDSTFLRTKLATQLVSIFDVQKEYQISAEEARAQLLEVAFHDSNADLGKLFSVQLYGQDSGIENKMLTEEDLQAQIFGIFEKQNDILRKNLMDVMRVCKPMDPMEMEEDACTVPITFFSDGNIYHQNGLNSGEKRQSASSKQPAAQRPAAKVINLNQKVAKPKPAPAAKPAKQTGLKNVFAKGPEAEKTKKLEVTHQGVKQVEIQTAQMKLTSPKPSSPPKQVENRKKTIQELEELEGTSEQATSAKRRAQDPLLEEEEEIRPLQKKARQHLSQESEEDLQPKKRSRVRRQVADSEEDEKEASEKVEDISEGMEVEEEDLSGLPEEERLLKQYQKTKRLPKGKKLITEEVTEFDDKGYFVTKKVQKIVDAEPVAAKKIDLTKKQPEAKKPDQKSKKGPGGKQMNMMAFMKSS